MKKILAVFLTGLTALVVVPIVFIALAVLNWNLVIPLVVAGFDSIDSVKIDKVFSTRFVHYLATPFTCSVKTVKQVYKEFLEIL